MDCSTLTPTAQLSRPKHKRWKNRVPFRLRKHTSRKKIPKQATVRNGKAIPFPFLESRYPCDTTQNILSPSNPHPARRSKQHLLHHSFSPLHHHLISSQSSLQHPNFIHPPTHLPTHQSPFLPSSFLPSFPPSPFFAWADSLS